MRQEAPNAIRRIVEETLREIFPGVGFDPVVIEPDTDEFGNPILWIRVVFAGRQKAITVGKTFDLDERLLARLETEGDTKAFPVVSFVPRAEWEALQADPA